MKTQIPDPHKLKDARLILGYSQVEAARLMGVTHATYSRWELGHCTPAPDRRERIHKFIALAAKGIRRARQ